MSGGGLLIAGAVVEVPGCTVVGPHDQEWATLTAGDCCPRHGAPTGIVFHRTIADDPDHVLKGAGPSGDAGGARRTAKFWADDPQHSGAGIVIGLDGEIACLCDLVFTEAYHATYANPWTIGIELHELPGGVLYEAQIVAAVAVAKTLCEHVGIQFQIPSPYAGHSLTRFRSGQRGCGIFGHRDLCWDAERQTDQRGHWDPGDAIFEALKDAGAEAYDFDAGQDVIAWKTRQWELNTSGAGLVVDGVPGPATTAALKAMGYRGGVFALGRV